VVVKFKEVIVTFHAMPHVVKLLDNIFHSLHPINAKRVCKELKIFRVNCCSNHMDDNPCSFLKEEYCNDLRDYFCFEELVRDTCVFLSN